MAGNLIRGTGESRTHIWDTATLAWIPWDGEITASVSGADGSVLDGATPSIKATVFDYPNSNPQAVIMVDTNGDPAAGGGSGGTEYTEDAAAAANPTGPMTLAIRKDTLASEVSADGDNIALRATSKGELYVKQTDAVAISGTVPVSGTFWQATQPVSAASLPLPSGAATETTLGTRLTESDFDTKVGSLTETAPASDTASSGLNGRLQRIAQRLTSLIALLPTALGAGGGLKVDGSGTALPVSGTFWQATQPISGTISASNTAGDVAHDGADSGNPVKVGGKAINAEPTAVANGDRANFLTDLVGKLITLPYSNPENFVSGAITTAMTGTTSTSLVSAPGVGLRNYITTIIVSNSHATVGTDVEIQDGVSGTVLMTIPAASLYGGAVITLPTPLRQPTTNTALAAKNVTTGASTKVSALGYKGA